MNKPKGYITKKVTWEDIERSVNSLSSRLYLMVEFKHIDSVYGVPRGGVIPAIMLSHRLDLEYLNEPKEKTLVIDDIYDTGRTMKSYKNNYTAALYWREGNIFCPLYYVDEIEKGVWLEFPWERK